MTLSQGAPESDPRDQVRAAMVPPKKKMKKSKRAPESLAPAWMMTLGDCMSLLVTFFVMLISFSSMDEAKLMSVMGVFQGALGVVNVSVSVRAESVESKEREETKQLFMIQGNSESVKIDPKDHSEVILDRMELKKQVTDYQHKLASIGSTVSLTLRDVEEGLVVRFESSSLFDPHHQLLPNATSVLGQIASLAANVGNEIRLIDCAKVTVELGGKKGTGWGARIQRSVNVGDLLVDQFGIESSRIGYATRVTEGDQPPVFEVMLMDRIGVRETSIQELWSEAESTSS